METKCTTEPWTYESRFKDINFATRAIHPGKTLMKHPQKLLQSSTISEILQQNRSKGRRFSEMKDNTATEMVEKTLACMEEAKFAVSFSSGMTGIAAVMHLLEPGQHVIGMKGFYSGTYLYLNGIGKSMKIQSTLVDTTDVNNIRNALRENTKMIWVESPSNPLFDVVDLEAIADIAHHHGAILVIDNSILTPFFQKPLKLGVDIVIHSCSKYLNGHSDSLLGVALTNNDSYYQKLDIIRQDMGGYPPSFNCYLLRLSLATVELRMQRHMENVLKVAQFLERHPRVERVLFSGLPSHPQHKLALKQSSGFSSLFGFYMKDAGEEQVMKFLGSLKVIAFAGSWGAYDSVALSPALWSHNSVKEEDRLAAGITTNLIRVSVGIEAAEDLIEDLENALIKAYEA